MKRSLLLLAMLACIALVLYWRRIALGCWMIDTGARMLPDVPCPCKYTGP